MVNCFVVDCVALLRRESYLAAAHDEDALVSDLPREDQRAAALDLWIGAFHCGCVFMSMSMDACTRVCTSGRLGVGEPGKMSTTTGAEEERQASSYR